MITVSVRQLVSAIAEAEAFKLPDMSEGTNYLYNDLYDRLTRGEDVRLSAIDWERFELDDVDTMRELHFNVLEDYESKSYNLTNTLRGIPPVTTAAAFV